MKAEIMQIEATSVRRFFSVLYYGIRVKKNGAFSEKHRESFCWVFTPLGYSAILDHDIIFLFL